MVKFQARARQAVVATIIMCSAADSRNCKFQGINYRLHISHPSSKR